MHALRFISECYVLLALYVRFRRYGRISSFYPAMFHPLFANISELPNVTAGLRERGWSEAEIDQALGGNWLRVYEQVWGA